MSGLTKEMIEALRKPFHPSQITFKPGATKGERAIALAYAELRVYMNRLDDIFGGDWSVDYQPWGNDRIICRLSIHGIMRSSTGEMAAQDEKNEIGGTVAEAQAFKRACTMFGLGRYLYSLPTGWADFDPAKKAFTEQAKAKLQGVLIQHYRRATEGFHDAPEAPQTPVDEDFGTIKPNHTSDAEKGHSARAERPNPRGDLIKEISALHKESADKRCTEKQYQYLAGLMDDLTGNKHGAILSYLCQDDISSENRPGLEVANLLFNKIAQERPRIDANGQPMKDAKGKALKVKNPSYDPDFCNLIADMAAHPQEA